MRFYALFFIFFFSACTSPPKLSSPVSIRSEQGGEALYKKLSGLGWRDRDSIIIHEIISGNRPGFLNKLVPVRVHLSDSSMQGVLTIFVTADYLSIGTNSDWARVPMTPMAAQKIADSLNCSLPTPEIVDLIWQAAEVKLEPMPLYAHRDSGLIFWHHHLIIEGLRKGQKGLIAGIKKDIVISPKPVTEKRTDRVAIYGWHHLTGVPIQPIYKGHVNWYVDYSHGVRLVYKKARWKGRWISLEAQKIDPELRQLIINKIGNIYLKYSY